MRPHSFRGLSLVTFVLAGAAALASACSTKTNGASSGGGGGGGDGGDLTDAGTDGSFTVGCPSTPPWTRTAANGPKNPCSKEGQLCEYGTDFFPGCNTIVQCIDGEWSVPSLPGGGGSTTCGSSGPPPVPPNAAECPATRAQVTTGDACTATSTCAYDGARCSCGVFCPSYPVGQQPCNPDAGITTNCCDLSKPKTWFCFDGPKSCTAPRPHLGDPCTTGDTCALGPPVECGQSVLACTDGTWQFPNNQCPISTRQAKKEIDYVSPDDAARLRRELLDVRVASYRYKAGDPSRHLGFVIEDMPAGSPAVLTSRDRVDLYGYVSMAVVAIQEQQKQIDRLESELARANAARDACRERPKGK